MRSYQEAFAQADRLVLIVHQSPDGDAIASALALGIGLRRLGKYVDIVCRDTIPPLFQFVPEVKSVRHDFLVGDYDVVVTLDCGDLKRTGFADRLTEFVHKKKKPLINIDHHAKNDLQKLATINIVKKDAPATCALVLEMLEELKVDIDHKIATCLLTGLYTDTGGFKHANTTPTTLALASRLLAAGARLKDISANLSLLTSVPKLKLWGVAMSRLTHLSQYDIVLTVITQEDMVANGATEKDIAGIAAIISTIPARASFLIVEITPGVVQARIRTKHKNVNLSEFAHYFGGGGQRQSAGFTLSNFDLKQYA